MFKWMSKEGREVGSDEVGRQERVEGGGGVCG